MMGVDAKWSQISRRIANRLQSLIQASKYSKIKEKNNVSFWFKLL